MCHVTASGNTMTGKAVNASRKRLICAPQAGNPSFAAIRLNPDDCRIFRYQAVMAG